MDERPVSAAIGRGRGDLSNPRGRVRATAVGVLGHALAERRSRARTNDMDLMGWWAGTARRSGRLVVCRLIAADDVVPSSLRRGHQEQGPEELPWFLGSSALLMQHSPSPHSTTSESSPATHALSSRTRRPSTRQRSRTCPHSGGPAPSSPYRASCSATRIRHWISHADRPQ
jgi:hypothetical protein